MVFFRQPVVYDAAAATLSAPGHCPAYLPDTGGAAYDVAGVRVNEILSRLLAVNPNDNQGVRYELPGRWFETATLQQ